MPAPCPRLDVPAYSFAATIRLERELGVSHPLAQVLVRRGLGDADEAREFLAAEEEHPPAAFAGIDDVVAKIRRHVDERSRITVHGDYDVDGVCSTAILVRSLRRLGARVDWYLPSRTEDGYGLSLSTIDRLDARGTELLITVDCAITAVEEVAAARAAGMDVVVTDHHAPRADGALPDAPLVHPALCDYPCADLCATAVAAKLAEALEAAAGVTGAEEDADLVALATVADCVPLRGENRRLVRDGLRALAGTAKPGLRALMRVAEVDPSDVDAHALGFRLAPRINAAGRLSRADAGLELLLCEDDVRAREIADELDSANAERRHVEQRILFEAEAQVAQAGERPAYVLAGEEWHPGVIGIVASRIAERHHRPAVLIALDGARGTGSGRSIPGFDLLGGFNACAEELARHGGHRAAAGLEIERDRIEAFRAGFEAFAESVLAPEDLIPRERVDAVVAGDALSLSLAEELETLEPFGTGNPAVSLLVPAASFADAQPMGEGKHVRFTVHGGGVRSRAVAFSNGGRLPVDDDEPVDATFRLERNAWNGAVEPRLVLRCASPAAPGAVEVLGEPASFLDGVLAELDAPIKPGPVRPYGASERGIMDRRRQGLAGTLGDLVGTGDEVLVVCADVPRRLRGLADRLGGFALCSYLALEREPGVADGFPHLLALDPPTDALQERLLGRGPAGGWAHMAWGEPELRFAQQINEHEYGLRTPLSELYRALRERGGAAGEELESVLQGDAPQSRSPALAGRLLRVLEELGLLTIDRDRWAVAVAIAERTSLERSEAFRAYQRRHEDGQRFLSEAIARAA